MIIDTSVLIALLKNEAEAPNFVTQMLKADSVALSAANYLETGIVVDALGDPILTRRLDDLLQDLGVEVVSVTPAQARIARQAYRDYGKGSGHPAGLNFGDCFSYALAASTRQSLLFKGDDFGHTDLMPAHDA